MNRAGQARVAALLEEAWGDRVEVEPKHDGSVTAYLRGDGSNVTVIEVASESSPLLVLIARIAADGETDERPPEAVAGSRGKSCG